MPAAAGTRKKPTARRGGRVGRRHGRLGNAVCVLVQARLTFDPERRRAVVAADLPAARRAVRVQKSEAAEAPPDDPPPAEALPSKPNITGAVRGALTPRPFGTTRQLQNDIRERHGVGLRPADITAAVGHFRSRGFDPAGLGPRLLSVLPLLVERLGVAALVKIVGRVAPAPA